MPNALRTALLLAVAVILSAPAAAEEPATRDMHLSLSECIEIASGQQHGNYAQSRFCAGNRGRPASMQRRNSFPPATLGTNYGLLKKRHRPEGGRYLRPDHADDHHDAGRRPCGRVSIRGIESLSISNLRCRSISRIWRPARRSARASGNGPVKVSRQQTIFLVKQRYFTLLQRIEQFDLAKEQVSYSEEDLRREKTMYEIGSRTIADVLRAESLLASDRVALIARENDVAIARSQLAFSLGLSPDVNIVPTEKTFPVAPLPVTYRESLERALEGHPEILAQRHRMLASKDQLKATKYSVRFPSITGSAGYGWQLNRGDDFSGVEDLFVKNYSYNAGISVSVPIFNGLTAENSIKVQRLEYLRSREQLDQAKRQRAMDIRLSYLNLERLRRSITANETAVKSAEENFRLQDQRYNLGGGTFLERQQAQLQLFTARNQLVQDRFQYQIELAQLEQHVGGTLVQTDE